MGSRTDVFLSHNWGEDEYGWENRDQVSLINTELTKYGYKTWFDDQKMWGNINGRISKGIAHTKGVIVFLKKKYHRKVGDEKKYDNCQKEFMFPTRNKPKKKMVAVLMEEAIREINTWNKLVDFHLSGEMNIDMSCDFQKKTYFSQQVEGLVNELRSKGIEPVLL